MISGLRPLFSPPFWCLRHHLSPAKAGALWILSNVPHSSEVNRRANFPLRGKSRAAGIGVHFHRPQGGRSVFHGRSPVVWFCRRKAAFILAPQGAHLASAACLYNSLGRQALNLPVRRSRLQAEPWQPRGESPGGCLNPRPEGPSTFGNTVKRRHLSPRPVSSNIAHSKKAPVIRLVLLS